MYLPNDKGEVIEKYQQLIMDYEPKELKLKLVAYLCEIEQFCITEIKDLQRKVSIHDKDLLDRRDYALELKDFSSILGDRQDLQASDIRKLTQRLDSLEEENFKLKQQLHQLTLPKVTQPVQQSNADLLIDIFGAGEADPQEDHDEQSTLLLLNENEKASFETQTPESFNLSDFGSQTELFVSDAKNQTDLERSFDTKSSQTMKNMTWSLPTQDSQCSIQKAYLENAGWVFYSEARKEFDPLARNHERLFDPEILKPEFLEQVPFMLRAYIKMPPTEALHRPSCAKTPKPAKDKLSSSTAQLVKSPAQLGLEAKGHKVYTKPFLPEDEPVGIPKPTPKVAKLASDTSPKSAEQVQKRSTQVTPQVPLTPKKSIKPAPQPSTQVTPLAPKTFAKNSNRVYDSDDDHPEDDLWEIEDYRKALPQVWPDNKRLQAVEISKNNAESWTDLEEEDEKERVEKGKYSLKKGMDFKTLTSVENAQCYDMFKKLCEFKKFTFVLFLLFFFLKKGFGHFHSTME